MKRNFFLTLTLFTLLTPYFVMAQLQPNTGYQPTTISPTYNPPPTIIPPTIPDIVLPPLSTSQQETNNILQTYNPSINLTGGGSGVGGVNFSGVAGSIFKCTNVGAKLVEGLKNLFSDKSKLLGKEVPTKEERLLKKAEEQARVEQCLDGIAYHAAKGMLQDLTNKTMQWVNTGFNGNPLYVLDSNSYMKSVSDEKINEFLGGVQNSHPIFGNSLRSYLTKSITGHNDGMINNIKDTPEGRAYKEFQEDFSKGGWSALLNPMNNPVGVALETSDRLARVVNNAQENIKSELEQGNGFLSMKKCVEWGTSRPIGPNPDGTNLSDTGGPIGPNPDGTNLSDTSEPKCLRYQTVTPGSVIASQVAYITNSPARQLEMADEINETLGGFFDGLLNRLFTQGLSSTSSRSGSSIFSGGGMGTNVVTNSLGETIAQYSGGGLSSGIEGYQDSNGNFNADFNITRPQLLRLIIKVQKDYLNKKRDSLVAMNRLVPTLGALDYCLPGPNPTWQSTLSDNYQSMVSSLVKPSNGETLELGVPWISIFGAGNPLLVTRNYTLYDKTTDNMVRVKPQSFRAITGQSVNVIPSQMEQAFNQVVSYFQNAPYDMEEISDAFENIAPTPEEKIYAKGFARSAFRESAKIIGYNQSIAEYRVDYQNDIIDTEDAIAELESIYAEVNQIVGDAKARHIAAQSRADTPVNMSCINSAYGIDTSPIVGNARLESDTPDPMVIQSLQARDYFYNNL